jgi:hypothetical protein
MINALLPRVIMAMWMILHCKETHVAEPGNSQIVTLQFISCTEDDAFSKIIGSDL